MRNSTDPEMAQAVRWLLEQQELVRAPKREPLPAPIGGGGGAPTVTIAAYNATDYSKRKADLLCTGVDDDGTVNRALTILNSKLNDAGGPIGGRILFTEGDFYLRARIRLYGSINLEGMGAQATRLHKPAAANTGMFVMDAAPGPQAVVEFESLSMLGHKALQTGGTDLDGVRCEPQCGAHLVMHGVNVDDFDGYGLFMNRPSARVSITSSQILGNALGGMFLFREGDYAVSNSLISGNGGHGIEAPGGRLHMVSSIVYGNTGAGFSSGGIFSQPGVLLVGNTFSANGSHGIYLEGYDSLIAGNFAFDNGGNGINANAVDRPIAVTGNVSYVNSLAGFYLQGNGGGVASGNTSAWNEQHGIYVLDDDWSVVANQVDTNGQGAANTYDGIHFASTAGNSSARANTVRQTGGLNQRYGIRVEAGATGTWIAGNDARGTFGTAAYSDAGTATINVWAGGFGDNQ